MSAFDGLVRLATLRDGGLQLLELPWDPQADTDYLLVSRMYYDRSGRYVTVVTTMEDCPLPGRCYTHQCWWEAARAAAPELPCAQTLPVYRRDMGLECSHLLRQIIDSMDGTWLESIAGLRQELESYLLLEELS